MLVEETSCFFFLENFLLGIALGSIINFQNNLIHLNPYRYQLRDKLNTEQILNVYNLNPLTFQFSKSVELCRFLLACIDILDIELVLGTVPSMLLTCIN